MSVPTAANAPPQISWLDDSGTRHTARWRSLAGHPAPARVQAVGDELGANEAYRLLDSGTALLWLGDYQGGHHLLQALGRRVDARLARKPRGPSSPATRATPAAQTGPRTTTAATTPATPASLKHAFFAQRQAQAQRARILGGLLLPFDADHGVPLRRAPDLRQPGLQAHGAVAEHYVASLRELLGLVGAFEWRKRGVMIRALDATIHPHHGVFSPVRGEYVDLVAQAPLPHAAQAQGAFDIGTGTGVLALVLAKRGLRVTATDLSAAALACAADNVGRLGSLGSLGSLGPAGSITLQLADLFPEGRAGLVVCNPPWLPAAPSSPLEAAVYDPDSAMLRGFLAGLAAHLTPGGEGWLLLSDLAEHLGLRSRDQLLGWIADAGLQVLGRIDTRPRHRKVADTSDPLHAARAAELTSLWRLGAA